MKMRLKPCPARAHCALLASPIPALSAMAVCLMASQAPAATLSGTVRGAEGGKPLFGAAVLVDDIGDWSQPDFAAQSDRDGGYAFTNLLAGSYFFQVQHGFKQTYQTNLVFADDSPVILDVALSPATMVQGSVQDALNALPIEGAQVTIVPQGGPMVTNVVYTTESDSFGFYDLAQLPPGAYWISAVHPAYLSSPTQQVAMAEGSRAVAFQLEPRQDIAQRADIHVQALCAVSGIQIANAPVRLTVYVDASGTGAYRYDHWQWTGPRGSTVFRGVPFGYFKVSANAEPAGQVRAWWKGYAPQQTHRFSGHQQVTFRLEPFKCTVKVRLMPQESWMNVQPYRSMYCQNFWVELAGADGPSQTYPPRTGITDYDGQVVFDEIPTVPFRLTIRRPGFNLRETVVAPDAQGVFPDWIDIARPDVRQGAGLRITLDIPGFISFDNNGPPTVLQEGSGGITLQGMKESNTDGYFKLFPIRTLTVPIRVDTRAESGTAWPGTYILSGSGQFYAPRVGADGRYYGANIKYSIPPTTITIIDRTNVVTDVALPLQINKAEVSGRLMTAETVVGENYDLVYRPVTNKTVQFLVHEEMTSWFPFSERSVEVKTDDNGQFHVELWPVDYGIRLPDREGEVSMSHCWGERMLVEDSTTGGWPCPQRWPAAWGPAPTSGDYLLLGYDFRTDKRTRITLLTRQRDRFNLRGFVRHDGLGGALRERVAFVKPDDTILSAPTDELLESGTAAHLLAGGSLQATNTVHVYDSKLSYRFTQMPAGPFSVEVPHARYTQTNAVAFTNFLWGAPGYLPASIPPTWAQIQDQEVLLPMQMNTFLTNRGKLVQIVEKPGAESNVRVTIRWLDDDAIEHRYEVAPRFVRCAADYGARLFSYSGSVFKDSMSVIVLHTANHKHVYYGTTGREVVAYEDEPFLLNADPYTLEVRARQEAMRELEIAGLSFKVRGASQVDGTPQTFASYSGDAILQGPGTNSNWTWKHVDYELASITNPLPHVVATIYANLNFDLRGQVINALTREGLPQASAHLIRADGGRLETYRAIASVDASGNFLFSNLQEGFRDFFVDVACTGYLPRRVRFTPGSPPVYTGNRPVLRLPDPVELTPLQAAFTNQVLDRCGFILGGVRAVGRGGSTQALNMTWSTQVTPFSGSFQQLQFDNPDGSPNPPNTFTYRDRIKEVWLINARVNLFTSDDMTVSDRDGVPMLPYQPNLPASEQYPQNKRRMPNPSNPAAVLAWLQDLNDPKLFYPATSASRDLSAQTVFFRKLSVQGASGLPLTAKGNLNVADLPRGEFLPYLAVVTEGGGAFYAPYSFTNHNQSPLQVVRVPTWLAFATDAMTVAGDVSATYKELKETCAPSVPDGKLSALPDYTGTITEQDGSLIYSYRLGVKWLEGSEAPGADLLGLGPGVLGIEFSSEAAIAFEGRSPSIVFDLGGRISTSDIDLQDLAPKIVSKLDIEGKITEVSGQARTVRRAGLAGDDWTDFSLTTQVGANLEGYIRYNLGGLTSKIPYVGPALYLADKAGVLQFFARADAAVRVDSIETWRTQEPERQGPIFLSGGSPQTPPVPPEIQTITYVQDDRDLTPQRHMFGGMRDTSILKTNSMAIGFNFGASLEAEADVKYVRLYGRAGLELTGDEENGTVLGKPSLRVAVNPYGDWPVVRRVTGQANMTLTARADLTIAEIGKTWTWPLVHIDHQFGTSNAVYVTDLGTHVWRQVKNYPPVQLVDSGPALLQSCLPMQRYCAAGNGLAFLSFDRDRGLTILMVSFHDAGAWSPPIEIAAAAQIIDVEMAQLPPPDGRWLAAWGEIASEDLQLLYPRCVIRSRLLDQGGWTAPIEVAQLEGQLRDLDLAIGPAASAIYLENPNGASSHQSRICAAALAGNLWSAPYVLRETSLLPASAVAGTGASGATPARIAVVAADLSIDSHFWDGQRSIVPGGAEHLALDPGPAQPAIALCTDDSHLIYAAWLDAASNLRLHRNTPIHPPPADPDFDWNSTPANSWTDLGVLFDNVNGAELRAAWLADATAPRLLLVWSDGASLRYSLADLTRMTAVGPCILTQNSEGRYHDLRIVPLAGLTARVLARFTGPVQEVRQFVIHATAGLASTDSDSDGLDDLAELDIADASPDDAIASIHDVQPQDDFDHDGFSNGEEIAAGSDPANPASAPPLDGVTVAISLPRAFEGRSTPASFIITRAASDPAAHPLIVRFGLHGTATPGADYAPIPGPIEIPPNERSVLVDVVPIPDAVPEGDEAVELRLLPDQAYTLGRPATAFVTIVDDAYDAWRNRHFTPPQLAIPSISADTADPDNDGNPNLIEFGMGLDPWNPDATPLEIQVTRDGDSLEVDLRFTRGFEGMDGLFFMETASSIVSPDWQDITALLQVIARETGLQSEMVILRDVRTPADSHQRFYRLQFVR